MYAYIYIYIYMYWRKCVWCFDQFMDKQMTTQASSRLVPFKTGKHTDTHTDASNLRLYTNVLVHRHNLYIFIYTHTACIYIYIYIYIYITYSYTDIIYIYSYRCVYIWIYNLYIFIYTDIIYIYSYLHTLRCVYIHTPSHTRVFQKYINMCIHIYIDTQMRSTCTCICTCTRTRTVHKRVACCKHVTSLYVSSSVCIFIFAYLHTHI